jgi:hypothetical protein
MTNFSNVVMGFEAYGMASFLDIEELVWIGRGYQ